MNFSLSSLNFLGDTSNQDPVTIRLLDLVQKTDYKLVQENGQRRMTAPELTKEKSERAKGAEIFLGRLPRDCYEDELMPILQKIGRPLELRLMLDFSGSTRGYAFALFENCLVARRACQELNGFEIRPGHHIGVVKSVDNCRLFFGGVPKDKTRADFMDELGKILDGITDIYLYPSAQDKSLNRGFIFVEFKDHRSAAMARRRLIPGRVLLWDHEIAVDWADPEPGDSVDDDIMETVTVLFVRNLSLETPQQVVREIFQRTTGVPIMKIKKINHFAFVHYETREQAQRVLDILTSPGGVAEKEEWEIRWAKPISSTKNQERQRCINNAAGTTASTCKLNGKQIVGRKSSAKLQAATQLDYKENVVNKCTLYQKILENFVTSKFCAICRFQTFRMIEADGYVCKIAILKSDKVLFQFQGDLLRTQEEAINLTSRNVYYRLCSVLDNTALDARSSNMCQDKSRIDPHGAGPSHSWQREICMDPQTLNTL